MTREPGTFDRMGYDRPDPDPPKPSEALKGDCNATDGFSVCTLEPGHGPRHWDERTQHEWGEDE